MPSSRGSSQPRDRTRVSVSPALAGGFFTTSTTWEAQFLFQLHLNPQLFASLKAMNKLLTMILLWRYPVLFYLKIKCMRQALVLWEDLEGAGREGGGKGDRDGEDM